jgi:hypothetical protein
MLFMSYLVMAGAPRVGGPMGGGFPTRRTGNRPTIGCGLVGLIAAVLAIIFAF